MWLTDGTTARSNGTGGGLRPPVQGEEDNAADLDAIGPNIEVEPDSDETERDAKHDQVFLVPMRRPPRR
jgi:hypothetical protein